MHGSANQGKRSHSTWQIFPQPDYFQYFNNGKPTDLCAQCTKISLANAFNRQCSESNIMGNEICRFQGLIHSMVDSDCGFCRALATKVFAHGKNYMVQVASGRLWALPASSILGTKFRTRLPTVVGITLGERMLEWDGLLQCVSGLQGVIMPLFGETDPFRMTCHGINISKTLNYGRIRDMLLSCAQQHQSCQKPTHEFPVRARVIDCKTRRLVSLEQGYRYAALSYVWGKRSSTQWDAIPHPDTLEGVLPFKLPRTIEDAIKTTKILGLRYLWVDRYCIEQYHSADKQHQINQMSNIYNRAIITICAIDSHDNAGLCGISIERDTPGIFYVRNIPYTICSGPGVLHEALENSAWFKRGWTFQEALLSRRCLILTQEEAFLLCGFSFQQEGLHHNIPSVTNRAEQSMKSIYSLILDRELRWSPIDRLQFIDYVRHYQKRKFTFETDALPAFKGILSILYNQSYYGVVVFECPLSGYTSTRKRAGFAYGLIWEVETHYKSGENRRTFFPSWSWIARKNSLARFPLLDAHSTLPLSPIGLGCASVPVIAEYYVANIHTIGHGGSIVPIGHYLTQHSEHKVVPESSSVLEITSLTARFEFSGATATYSGHVCWQDGFGDPADRLHAELRLDQCDDPKERRWYSSRMTGFAVLLLAAKFRESPYQRSYWLVVQQSENNDYERTGLLCVQHKNLEETIRDNNHPATTLSLM